MNPWFAVILASVAVFSWKLFGYLLPQKLFASKTSTKVAAFLTIALLSALVGVQTFVSGSSPKLDERFVALGISAILLKLKTPFIVVVLVAAAIAGGLRLIF